MWPHAVCGVWRPEKARWYTEGSKRSQEVVRGFPEHREKMLEEPRQGTTNSAWHLQFFWLHREEDVFLRDWMW